MKSAKKHVIIYYFLGIAISLIIDIRLYDYGKSIINYGLMPMDVEISNNLDVDLGDYFLRDKYGFSLIGRGVKSGGLKHEVNTFSSYAYNDSLIFVRVQDKNSSIVYLKLTKNIKIDRIDVEEISKESTLNTMNLDWINLDVSKDKIELFSIIRNLTILATVLLLVLLSYIFLKNAP